MPSRSSSHDRVSFANIDEALPLPDLVAIQRDSFKWFLDRGLAETFADISPIEDFNQTMSLSLYDPHFLEPNYTAEECREKDLTYAAPLTMEVSFVNKETGEIREQRVFMGDFPMMTDVGTFVINGTERVIVTQLVRSPGAYLMEPKDSTKQVFTANLMPSRGSWLELEIDKKGIVYARIDRKRKLPITTLLRALPSEDPATGSAAVCFAGVIHKFDGLPDGLHKRTIEQGYEMGRPSDLWLEADVAGAKLVAVRVAGQAVQISSGVLDI